MEAPRQIHRPSRCGVSLPPHRRAERYEAGGRGRAILPRATEAEITVLEPDAGAQVETEWRPLLGITYDHKDNILEIAVEHHDHLITNPDEIYVEESGEGMPSSMEVVAGQTKHIIALR